jgi:rhomboid family GlyGly-CTERM serine protease
MLVGARATLLAWSLVLLWTVLVIDLGFWIFDSNMLWYVGLSGVLHGLLVAGAIAGLASNRGESLAILVLIFTKVAFEQIVGPLPGSETTSGGPVVVNAHLYGAIAGLPAGVALWLAGRISAA